MTWTIDLTVWCYCLTSLNQSHCKLGFPTQGSRSPYVRPSPTSILVASTMSRDALRRLGQSGHYLDGFGVLIGITHSLSTENAGPATRIHHESKVCTHTYTWTAGINVACNTQEWKQAWKVQLVYHDSSRPIPGKRSFPVPGYVIGSCALRGV